MNRVRNMDYEQLLKKLKKIRLQKSISLRSLGKKLGVSGQYLSMIERGKVPLKVKDFFLICSILEVLPKDVMVEKKEYQTVADRIQALPERDFKIIKDLLLLMELSKEDL